MVCCKRCDKTNTRGARSSWMRSFVTPQREDQFFFSVLNSLSSLYQQQNLDKMSYQAMRTLRKSMPSQNSMFTLANKTLESCVSSARNSLLPGIHCTGYHVQSLMKLLRSEIFIICRNSDRLSSFPNLCCSGITRAKVLRAPPIS